MGRSTKPQTKNPVSPAQIRAYGIAAEAACNELGIFNAKDKAAYRHAAVLAEAGCTSIKEIRTKSDYDRIMARLWTDAGQVEKACHYMLNEERSLARTVQVLAKQVMQLTRCEDDLAWNYLSGILAQSKISYGRNDLSGSYWMDLTSAQLRIILQILDTHRRRLIKSHSPEMSATFSPAVRYTWVGDELFAVPAAESYHASAPGAVRVSVRRG